MFPPYPPPASQPISAGGGMGCTPQCINDCAPKTLTELMLDTLARVLAQGALIASKGTR